jgi:four helix bundle protein
MQRFTELRVWQLGHALTLRVYEETLKFPSSERFGITSQLRRAAASVPSNIAEGSKRTTNPAFAQHLNIAEGSLAETEYLLMLSRDLGYLSSRLWDQLSHEVDELARMLHGLRVKVEQRR